MLTALTAEVSGGVPTLIQHVPDMVGEGFPHSLEPSQVRMSCPSAARNPALKRVPAVHSRHGELVLPTIYLARQEFETTPRPLPMLRMAQLAMVYMAWMSCKHLHISLERAVDVPLQVQWLTTNRHG